MKRLTDSRLQEIKGNPRPTVSDADAQSMADELLELRSKVQELEETIQHMEEHPPGCRCYGCYIPYGVDEDG